ncbi:DUF6150 family protein [Salinimicrobium sediminilitoris]|uniref:DUF6150 family protein n=1 Tax=Salinimicrobium sediminilitoris TaxID=2876715 RepID=UPI001E3729EA|nr:DUF6150 family protein [Salinimicrobium sediminilitoris]MCC8360275.1 DUF6150 family protein [Salinimicrobium sediminilitoris]
MRGLYFLLFSSVLVSNAYSQKLFIAKYASDADFKVIVVEQPSQADLKVYNEKVVSQVKGNSGIWYFTKMRSEADKKILFVKYLSEADLKIYFVNHRSQAGWISEEKKSLLNNRE